MPNNINAHNIALALRATYYAMHRNAYSTLAPFDVTTDQFVLLSLLTHPADKDGITQQELVRRAASDPNTVRAMLVLLEKRGLVKRRSHRTDGRARSVALTPAGRKAYDQLWKETNVFRNRINAALSPADAEKLMDYLQFITEAMAPEVAD